jgi:hypothetical protein
MSTNELPWWIEQELADVVAIHELVRADAGYAIPGTIYDDKDIKYNHYKAEVLDKYRDNKYCHCGYDKDTESYFIRFLNTDSSKPPDSMLCFRYVSGSDKVLMVEVADILNIPPRQLSHWVQHQI